MEGREQVRTYTRLFRSCLASPFLPGKSRVLEVVSAAKLGKLGNYWEVGDSVRH